MLFVISDCLINHILLLISEKPSPPHKLGVTDVTKDCVSLAWLKPEHDGGSRITNYLVEALEKGQDKWIKCGSTKSTNFVVYGLRENAEYYFRVRAENHAGLSDHKDTVLPVLVKDQLGKSLHYFYAHKMCDSFFMMFC